MLTTLNPDWPGPAKSPSWEKRTLTRIRVSGAGGGSATTRNTASPPSMIAAPGIMLTTGWPALSWGSWAEAAVANNAERTNAASADKRRWRACGPGWFGF